MYMNIKTLSKQPALVKLFIDHLIFSYIVVLKGALYAVVLIQELLLRGEFVLNVIHLIRKTGMTVC